MLGGQRLRSSFVELQRVSNKKSTISKVEIAQYIEKMDFVVFGIVIQRRPICLGVEIFLV